MCVLVGKGRGVAVEYVRVATVSLFMLRTDEFTESKRLHFLLFVGLFVGFCFCV